MKRIIVGMTGASGAPFAVRLLHILRSLPEIETHLVMSPSARLTLAAECDLAPRELVELVHATYQYTDIGAAISSGSFRTFGMIVVPCSVKTMSNIATGNTGDLITRAADVVIKERRRLVLAVRETPLHAGHLENMLNLSRRGVSIFPPVPAFYHRPKSVQDIVDQSCMRMLDQLDIEVDAAPRWGQDISLKQRAASDDERCSKRP